MDLALGQRVRASELGVKVRTVVGYLGQRVVDLVVEGHLLVAEVLECDPASLAEGHFPSGSMGPKIEASIKFLSSGGKRTIITSLEALDDAISNKRGTVITH